MAHYYKISLNAVRVLVEQGVEMFELASKSRQ